MDIYFGTADGSETYQVPIPPTDMPELSKSSKNEEFESYQDGNYSIIGNVSLTTFTIDSWLPEYPNKYSYARSQINPYLLINMWSNAMDKKIPLNCIMLRGKNVNNISPEILNWFITVESMSWYPDKTKDIKYKVSFKEYRSPVPITTEQIKTISSAVEAMHKAISVSIGGNLWGGE